jgi:hypothetical protein
LLHTPGLTVTVSGEALATFAEPVPVPLDVKKAYAAPPVTRATTSARLLTANFLCVLKSFILFGLPLIVGLDGFLKRVVVSPFAPHGLGDQTGPVDQSVTLCCQRVPRTEATVDAGQLGRTASPLLPEPQHLLNQKYPVVRRIAAATNFTGRLAQDRSVTKRRLRVEE